MPHTNRIYNMTLIEVFINGSINMGNAIHKGYAANSEGVGGQSVIGDSLNSPCTHDYEFNFDHDPDVVDQPQKQA